MTNLQAFNQAEEIARTMQVNQMQRISPNFEQEFYGANSPEHGLVVIDMSKTKVLQNCDLLWKGYPARRITESGATIMKK